MEYEIIVDKSIKGEENATQYLFIEMPYIDGKTISDDDLNKFFREEFEVRINSAYDCTGKWFTCGINAKIVDDNDWDKNLLIACSINWGLDI